MLIKGSDSGGKEIHEVDYNLSTVKVCQKQKNSTF